jgi:hypothetical protein
MERLGKLEEKNSYLIGTRAHDLPACSIAPKPSTLSINLALWYKAQIKLHKISHSSLNRLSYTATANHEISIALTYEGTLRYRTHMNYSPYPVLATQRSILMLSSHLVLCIRDLYKLLSSLFCHVLNFSLRISKYALGLFLSLSNVCNLFLLESKRGYFTPKLQLAELPLVFADLHSFGLRKASEARTQTILVEVLHCFPKSFQVIAVLLLLIRPHTFQFTIG